MNLICKLFYCESSVEIVEANHKQEILKNLNGILGRGFILNKVGIISYVNFKVKGNSLGLEIEFYGNLLVYKKEIL